MWTWPLKLHCWQIGLRFQDISTDSPVPRLEYPEAGHTILALLNDLRNLRIGKVMLNAQQRRKRRQVAFPVIPVTDGQLVE